MAAGCGASCARIMLIVFNIVFWLSGAGLVAVGIWLMIDNDVVNYIDVLKALDDSGELLEYAAYVLIGVGAFVLIVGFFGCCGAIKENKCMLGMYIFFLVIVMGAEIAVGVFGIIFKDEMNTILDKASDTFQETLEDYYRPNDDDPTDDQKAFTEGLDYIQFEAQCCAWNGAQDYKDVPLSIPPTCCVLKDGVQKEKDSDEVTYTDAVDEAGCKAGTAEYVNIGCKDDLEDWVDDNALIIIGVGIGIACLELFGFIFAVCLCRNIEE